MITYTEYDQHWPPCHAWYLGNSLMGAGHVPSSSHISWGRIVRICMNAVGALMARSLLETRVDARGVCFLDGWACSWRFLLEKWRIQCGDRSSVRARPCDNITKSLFFFPTSTSKSSSIIFASCSTPVVPLNYTIHRHIVLGE
jgi:hypothetical protein